VLELQHELQRRIANLKKDREKLIDELHSIDIQLETLGVDPGTATPVRAPSAAPTSKPARTRPTNERPLIEVLHDVVRDQSALTTREAAEAAIARGYQTTSKTFVNIVNTAMNKDPRFVRADGRWVVGDDAEA
jgi:hypothetical protein